jgi:tetratricopeptide (TPR) repeat protein
MFLTGGSGLCLTLFFLAGCAANRPVPEASEPPRQIETITLADSADTLYRREVGTARQILESRPASRDDYASGLSHALNAMRLAPDSIEAVLLSSDLNLRLLRIRDAILVLENAYQTGIPHHEHMPERIAWLYARAGASGRAVDWYETAITHHPDDANLRTGYVNALIRDRRFAEAREFVDQASLRAILTLHLGISDLEQDSETDVRELVMEALDGLRSATDAERIDAAMLLANMAVLHTGESETIPTDLYRHAVSLLEPLSATSADPEPVWNLLSELYEQLGESDKADSIRDRLRNLAY